MGLFHSPRSRAWPAGGAAAYGGGGGPIFMVPAVVTWLSAAMIAVFAGQALLPDGIARPLEFHLGFLPLRLSYALDGGFPLIPAIVPLIGHAFLHGNLLHLFVNLLWMVVFGAGVARRLGTERGGAGQQLFGSVVFLLFFAICSIGGALFYYLFHTQSDVLLVGASGGISGLMGGALRFALRPGARLGHDGGALARANSRPMLAAAGAFVILNLATAVGIGVPEEGMRIAWEAHIGGFFVGMFGFPLFDRGEGRRRPL